MIKYTNQTEARTRVKPSFICGSVETAKAGRSIPLSMLYAKFLRGENIADYAMGPSRFNPLEDNPFKRKGYDLCDTFPTKREVNNIVESANGMLAQEQQFKEEPPKENPPAPSE